MNDIKIKIDDNLVLTIFIGGEEYTYGKCSPYELMKPTKFSLDKGYIYLRLEQNTDELTNTPIFTANIRVGKNSGYIPVNVDFYISDKYIEQFKSKVLVQEMRVSLRYKHNNTFHFEAIKVGSYYSSPKRSPIKPQFVIDKNVCALFLEGSINDQKLIDECKKILIAKMKKELLNKENEISISIEKLRERGNRVLILKEVLDTYNS